MEPFQKETANKFVEHMKSILEKVKSILAKAKNNMARYYNHRRMPALTYEPGDKIFLDASDIKTTCPSQKLSHRYLRPYSVEQAVSKHVY